MKDGFELGPDQIGAFFILKSFCHQAVETYLCRPETRRGFNPEASESRPVRLRARTPPFHGGDTSSNLVRATKQNPAKFFAGFLIFCPP